MTKHVIYLHGFASSPKSIKAQQTAAFFKQQGLEKFLSIPDLTLSPKAAIEHIEQLIEQIGIDHVAGFIGSSLGGYYAHFLAERHQKPAALINPAIRPFDLLQDHVGQIDQYHGQGKSLFKAQYLDELLALRCQVSTPERYLVLLQTGDETLDYRQAFGHFQATSMYRGLGGNHSFEHFEDFLPIIYRFLLG
ncbi:MAG: YqiA/YcfP family alpha/beta fold hydrolase [Pseudomonadota bacterium]|nr:YqiA/YcfP family alpha/beta fold hydrolase [Pseudomonadota bacterium]